MIVGEGDFSRGSLVRAPRLLADPADTGGKPFYRCRWPKGQWLMSSDLFARRMKRLNAQAMRRLFPETWDRVG